MFIHACERTVLQCICIMENQVVFENSSQCKTKAPRFVSFLKRPCFHSIHFWTKRTRLGHPLLQVLIIYFAALNWANTIMKLSLFSTDSGSVIKKIPFEKIRSFGHWERRPSKGCFVGLGWNGLCEWSRLRKRKEPLRLFVLEFVSLIQERQLQEEARIDNSTQDNITTASHGREPFMAGIHDFIHDNSV